MPIIYTLCYWVIVSIVKYIYYKLHYYVQRKKKPPCQWIMPFGVEPTINILFLCRFQFWLVVGFESREQHPPFKKIKR